MKQMLQRRKVRLLQSRIEKIDPYSNERIDSLPDSEFHYPVPSFYITRKSRSW